MHHSASSGTHKHNNKTAEKITLCPRNKQIPQQLQTKPYRSHYEQQFSTSFTSNREQLSTETHGFCFHNVHCTDVPPQQEHCGEYQHLPFRLVPTHAEHQCQSNSAALGLEY